MDRDPPGDDKTMLRLRAGEFLPLHGAQGRGVAVLRGRVWIAQGHGRHDAFVGPGRTFRLDDAGDVMLHALEASSLRLTGRAAAHPRIGWRARLRRAAHRWFAALDGADQPVPPPHRRPPGA